MTSTAPLQNVYYERKTGTAKPCYICKRPTQTVLATIKTEDFLYTCEGHLSDPGFASPIAAPASRTPTPSEDDIRKVVSDYEARQARKAEKAKEAEGSKDADKDKSVQKEAKSPSPAPTPATPAPSHRKFALHRQIFEMRRNELKRRDQGTKAKEVLKGMPPVPRTAF